MKKILLFILIIFSCNGYSQNYKESIVTYNGIDNNQSHLDSLFSIFQGAWKSKDTSFIKSIEIKDSIWSISFDDKQWKYQMKINFMVDENLKKQINLMLFREGRNWENYKGKTEDNEVLIYFLEFISLQKIILKSTWDEDSLVLYNNPNKDILDKDGNILYKAQTAQECNLKKVKESVWIPETNVYQKVASDSTLMLVFQRYFDDSINVFVSDTFLFGGYYKTDMKTIVVPKFDKITLENYRIGKSVKIELVNKNECVAFEIREGFKFAYITREEDGKWFVEYSEYKRKYY